MRTIRTAAPAIIAIAFASVAFAQGPSTPNGWGQSTAANAQSGGLGAAVSAAAKAGERGYATERHDPSQYASHPTPPGLIGDAEIDPATGLPIELIDPATGEPIALVVPVGFF
jgi:hypothetical protein